MIAHRRSLFFFFSIRQAFHLVITASVQEAIRSNSTTLDALPIMRVLDLHDQLQVSGIPHLDAAIIAEAVQEVLVPQDGRDSVFVGLLTSACF